MEPLLPFWQQPSHPDIQDVVINSEAFTSSSFSKVHLAPFAVYAKLSWPPCTVASEPTYATVQMSKKGHLNLNSDLVYINHSCEPSLIFDMASMNILAGPKGLRPGDELTFFYPSTEWSMAQSFACLCGHASCRGTIAGAKDMTALQLEGVWLNAHIRDLLEQQQQKKKQKQNGKGDGEKNSDATAMALEDALAQAEKVVEAARLAVRTYAAAASTTTGKLHPGRKNESFGPEEGLNRRGPTSRELSGEMGGDTDA